MHFIHSQPLGYLTGNEERGVTFTKCETLRKLHACHGQPLQHELSVQFKGKKGYAWMQSLDIQCWCSHFKGVKILERVQRRASKMIEGLKPRFLMWGLMSSTYQRDMRGDLVSVSGNYIRKTYLIVQCFQSCWQRHNKISWLEVEAKQILTWNKTIH